VLAVPEAGPAVAVALEADTHTPETAAVAARQLIPARCYMARGD
jgi:hypothetical protein